MDEIDRTIPDLDRGRDLELTRGQGFVDLVGAGPGDPELITRKGAAALALADVVVYDHLVHTRLLDLAPPTAERIFAGKSRGRCALRQDEINQLLVGLAHVGRRVVRLKGGDPFVFGRGAEEVECLVAAGVPFRVIPGITAGIGVTSSAGIPVTHRGVASAVAFVTGHGDPVSPFSSVDWSILAKFPGTLVIYMGVSRLQSLCELLIKGGKSGSTLACVIQNGTLHSQRTVVGTLETLPELAKSASIAAPALMVVGEVLSQRDSLRWFEARPLFGKTVVVTRPLEEAVSWNDPLEALGAEVIQAPMVRILPVEDPAELDAALGNLADFDWVVFTSANGVNHFLGRMIALGGDVRSFGNAKIAAIGPKSADALARFHLRADLVPGHSRSEGLAEELRDRARTKSILLAGADRSRPLLEEQLRQVARVRHVTVYRNVDASALPAGLAERIVQGSIDWITITSSAIVERLHQLLSIEARAQVGASVKLASLSSLTTSTANRLGWQVASEAESSTWEGLVQAILKQEGVAKNQRNSL